MVKSLLVAPVFFGAVQSICSYHLQFTSLWNVPTVPVLKRKFFCTAFSYSVFTCWPFHCVYCICTPVLRVLMVWRSSSSDHGDIRASYDHMPADVMQSNVKLKAVAMSHKSTVCHHIRCASKFCSGARSTLAPTSFNGCSMLPMIKHLAHHSLTLLF
jgi:hypothetical protein